MNRWEQKAKTTGRLGRDQQRGFSLAELLVVTSMLLVIAGSALPAVISTISDLQLHSVTLMVVSQLRDLRMQAINNDVSYTLATDQTFGRTRLYIDVNRNGRADKTEAAAVLPAAFTFERGAGQAGVPQGLGFIPQSGDAAFNPRGVPCVMVGRACKTAVDGQVAGFFYTIRDQRPIGESGLNGVSIAPNGRIQIWTFTGGAWREVQ